MGYGWRGSIGLVVATSDLTVEMDFHALKPDGVAVYAARVPLPETSEYEEKLRAYKGMAEAAPAAAMLLSDARPDIIIFCCTAGSVLNGIESDREIIHAIEAKTGIKTITASTALVEQLKWLRITRIDLLTPFTTEFSPRVEEFLCGNVPGLQITNRRDLGIVGGLPKCMVPPSTIYAEAKQLASTSSQALLIACTSFQVLPVREALERDLGKPILSGNTAMMWLACRYLGIGMQQAGTQAPERGSKRESATRR